jgi:hypothetical protein
MARKTTATEEPEIHGSVDAEAGVVLLQEQIEKAKQLLNDRPLRAGELAVWHKTTREYLVKIYGPNSPHIQTVIYAPGEGPVWLGMPDSVYDEYEASSLEHKIERLNGCILYLKREIEVSGNKKVEVQIP